MKFTTALFSLASAAVAAAATLPERFTLVEAGGNTVLVDEAESYEYLYGNATLWGQDGIKIAIFHSSGNGAISLQLDDVMTTDGLFLYASETADAFGIAGFNDELPAGASFDGWSMDDNLYLTFNGVSNWGKDADGQIYFTGAQTEVQGLRTTFVWVKEFK